MPLVSVMYPLKPLRKLEAAKGGMDPLPTRALSQVLPRARAHLYCAARQGAFIYFPRSHPHKADSPTVGRPACVCAEYTSTHSPSLSGDTSADSHSMLSLAMQSGAFLHLVVTLTALVARIAHLSSAVRGVLSTLHSECAHLFARLHVRSKWPIGPCLFVRK